MVAYNSPSDYEAPAASEMSRRLIDFTSEDNDFERALRESYFEAEEEKATCTSAGGIPVKRPRPRRATCKSAGGMPAAVAGAKAEEQLDEELLNAGIEASLNQEPLQRLRPHASCGSRVRMGCASS